MNQFSGHAEVPGVAMQLSRDILVAFVQVDLDDEVTARFRTGLLQRIHDTACRGVILDLSGLETIDSAEFAALRGIISMSEIMGTKTVLVGMRPGVVSSLIEAGADVDGLRAALNLDAAFALFEPEPAAGAPAEQPPHTDEALPADTHPENPAAPEQPSPPGARGE